MAPNNFSETHFGGLPKERMTNIRRRSLKKNIEQAKFHGNSGKVYNSRVPGSV